MLFCAVAALAGYDRRSLLKHDRGREAGEGGEAEGLDFDHGSPGRRCRIGTG